MSKTSVARTAPKKASSSRQAARQTPAQRTVKATIAAQARGPATLSAAAALAQGRSERNPPQIAGALRSGWIVINSSTSQGGIRYERTHLKSETAGDTERVEYVARKRADHGPIVRELDGLAKQADHVCRINCAWTALGWFVPDETRLGLVRAGFTDLQARAADANARAAEAGSAHRVRISYGEARIDCARVVNASEIVRTIAEVLLGIAEALRAGSVRDSKQPDGKIVRNRYRPAFMKARHLDTLAVGKLQAMIALALQSAEGARKELLDKLDRGERPDAAGASLDLRAIETAIAWFAEEWS